MYLQILWSKQAPYLDWNAIRLIEFAPILDILVREETWEESAKRV